jgi:hypothetical protein
MGAMNVPSFMDGIATCELSSRLRHPAVRRNGPIGLESAPVLAVERLRGAQCAAHAAPRRDAHRVAVEQLVKRKNISLE